MPKDSPFPGEKPFSGAILPKFGGGGALGTNLDQSISKSVQICPRPHGGVLQ